MFDHLLSHLSVSSVHVSGTALISDSICFCKWNFASHFHIRIHEKESMLNDTHMEELVRYWISTKIHWNRRLGASDVFQSVISSFNSIIVQMSEKHHSSIDSKDEWLLLSVTFTAKLELGFVLTFENDFS